jgi:hypothetical protein
MDEDQRANPNRQFNEIHARLQALTEIHHRHVPPAIAAAFGTIPTPTVLDDTVLKLHLRALGWDFSLKRRQRRFRFSGPLRSMSFAL